MTYKIRKYFATWDVVKVDSKTNSIEETATRRDEIVVFSGTILECEAFLRLIEADKIL